MNGYLARLVTRAGAAAPVQSLQPSVRSTAPLAEHDQRIGMSGFEAPVPGESLLPDEHTDRGTEPGGRLPSSTASDPPTAGDHDGLMLQRKIANPTVGPAVAAPARVPGRHAVSSPAAKQVVRVSSGAPVVRQGPDIAALPSAVSDQPGQHAATVAPRFVLPADHVPADAAPPPAGKNSPGPDPGAPPRAARRSLHDGAPRLEPHARTLATPAEPESVADTWRADVAADGPRIVIDRLNVEVVPPPERPVAVSRSGPSSAAAVSIIGPLGGGVPMHRYLSLRQR